MVFLSVGLDLYGIPLWIMYQYQKTKISKFNVFVKGEKLNEKKKKKVYTVGQMAFDECSHTTANVSEINHSRFIEPKEKIFNTYLYI